jgi:hypothetical protein
MQRGYKIAYAADAPIIHVHDETSGDILNRYRREAIALKRIMPAETFSFWDFVRLYIKNVWTDSRSAWKDGVLGSHFREIITFRLMQFWGTYKGFRQQGDVTSTLKRRFYYPNRDKSSGSQKSETVTTSRPRTEQHRDRRIDYGTKVTDDTVSHV